MGTPLRFFTPELDEDALRCHHFEQELLIRHGATRLAQITPRQLEQFRVGSSIQTYDTAWQRVIKHWKAATGRSSVPPVSELESWPDATLYALLRRETLPDVQEAAAFELRRRRSRYVNTPEFIAIARELQERRAGYDPAHSPFSPSKQLSQSSERSQQK